MAEVVPERPTAVEAQAAAEEPIDPPAEAGRAVEQTELRPATTGGPTPALETGVAVTTGTFIAQRGTAGCEQELGLVVIPPSTVGIATADALL